MSVEVKILFFAKAKELVGKSCDILNIVSPISYSQLLQEIVNVYFLSDIKKNIILAVNEEYCFSDSIIDLKSGDEIAVIPPLSEHLANLVTSPSCGAISIFVGTTRDNFEDKKVLSLEYEVYESMGIKALEQICTQIREQWQSVKNIAIYHRFGKVPVTESSIIIAISSPHREDALKATEWCINNVKKSVPIWKKEIYVDSQPQWKENKECLWSSNYSES